jgi:hypothetical protein
MGKVKLKQSTPRAVKNQLCHTGALFRSNAGPTVAIDKVFTPENPIVFDTRTDTDYEISDQNSLHRLPSGAMSAKTAKCHQSKPKRRSAETPIRSPTTWRWLMPSRSKFGPTSSALEIVCHPFARFVGITG